jgi:hypothetical protein
VHHHLHVGCRQVGRRILADDVGILPFRRPSDPTPQELREGVEPFDGWAINVRCLEDVDLDSIPIKKILGSRIKHDS